MFPCKQYHASFVPTGLANQKETANAVNIPAIKVFPHGTVNIFPRGTASYHLYFIRTALQKVGIMLRFFSSFALLLWASTVWAQADFDLGTLGSGVTTAFSGTTVGASNNIDTYSTSGPSEIYDQDIIYQFAVMTQGVLSLTSNDTDANPDMDFFLLSSLTTNLSNGLRQAQAIEANTDTVIVTQNGSWNVPSAGTYYLAVDAYRGNPSAFGTPANGRAGAFSGTLTFAATVPEPTATLLLCVGATAGFAFRRRFCQK